MECRKDLGRSGVESNSSKKIKEWSTALEEFYTVEKTEFIRKEGAKNFETVEKDLVFVKDSSALNEHICSIRGLEQDKVLVRVGIDGGQGSLKIIMNVFDREVNIYSKDTKNTGVNKVIVLAFVKDIPENHRNLQILFQKTNLNDMKFSLASDLKLLNIIVGLSSHGGKHSCLYCEGELSSIGELRTFNSLKERFESYTQNGSKTGSMKLYKNVIHPCLLDEEGEKLVLEVIPPPELHMLMKIVTEVGDILRLEPDIATWLKDYGIIWHGYNGGGLDGRNANKVLKSIPALEEYVLEQYPDYQPVSRSTKVFFNR